MKKVIMNAKIYTMNEQMPWADTCIIDGEYISYVGGYDAALIDAGTEAYDMKGKMVIPGFIDSHTHAGNIATTGYIIEIPPFDDAEELCRYVGAYAVEHPLIPYFFMTSYDTTLFGEAGPRKEMLDRYLPDRPCMIEDTTGHIHWVNSKMLELMEITSGTPDPLPGLIVFVRDSDGSPSGCLREWAWLDHIDKMYDKIGWRPPQPDPDLMQHFFDSINKFGITAMTEGFIQSEAEIESVYRLDIEGKLFCYYDGMVRCDTFAELPERIKLLKDWQQKYTSRHVKIETMKVFLDGTNECGNSASLEPYSNDPAGTNFGNLSMDTEELTKYFLLCNEEGLDIHLHIVCDRGFRTACDAAGAAMTEAGAGWRSQITLAHCELIDPADMLRPVELGLIVNFTPSWAGGFFGEAAKEYLGEERWNRMYQFGPMIDAGVVITFCDDNIFFFGIFRMDPFSGMQIGATRVDHDFPLDPEKYPGSVRPPESAKLSVETMLKGYTLNGAIQNRMAGSMGSIEAGKLANMSVLSENCLSVPHERLSEVKVETVLFEGKVIHGDLRAE